MLDGARDQGYTFFAAPEIEYFYFDDLDPRRAAGPIDQGSYFDLAVADLPAELRRRTVLMLEEMGIGVEHAQHEDAPGQHEIDLRYTDALDHGRHRHDGAHVVKELARQAGVAASFMPKPLADVQGSGMHTHLSLWRDEHERLHRRAAPTGSRAWRASFIAGLAASTPRDHRHHQPVGQLLQAPGARATRRRCSVSWARHDDRRRSCGSPSVKPGRIDSTRLEYRSPDPAANPYLAFAVILAAGLRGIERRLRAARRGRGNLFALDAACRQSLAPLPSTSSTPSTPWSLELSRDPRRAPGRVVPPQQARRVGRLPRPRSPPSSSSATCHAVSQSTCPSSASLVRRRRREGPSAVTEACYARRASARPSQPRSTSARAPIDGFAGAVVDARRRSPSPRR